MIRRVMAMAKTPSLKASIRWAVEWRRAVPSGAGLAPGIILRLLWNWFRHGPGRRFAW